VDEGVVLISRKEDDFNAIDPNIAFDTEEYPWMSFGRSWSGIKMRRTDPQTGKLSIEDTKLYSLASRERPANPPPNPPGLPGDWQAGPEGESVLQQPEGDISCSTPRRKIRQTLRADFLTHLDRRLAARGPRRRCHRLNQMKPQTCKLISLRLYEPGPAPHTCA
jgi:hypothetical protein